MATSNTVGASTDRANFVVTLILRIAGAALLVGMAYIHYHLYVAGYHLTAVGPAFIANAVLGIIAAIAVLVMPSKLLSITSALSSLLMLGTFAALMISIYAGLFGYKETTTAPLLKTTYVVEIAGTIVLAVLAILVARRHGMWKWMPGHS
ncbi:MAG TPA: hypothetical protein VFX16_26165 [Pseudonocardiaceae bacterium]|nr:hypothetical protein [Pseudonocardiaceae bacterium]